MIADSDNTHLMEQFITTHTRKRLLSVLSDCYNLNNTWNSGFASESLLRTGGLTKGGP